MPRLTVSVPVPPEGGACRVPWEADATAFAGLSPRMAGRLYRRVHVTRLSEAQATAANVCAALAAQLEKAANYDNVAQFLSGHGVQAEAGQFYFATADLDASTPERVRQTVLPWTRFQSTLARVPQMTRHQKTPTCPLLYNLGEEYLLARAAAQARGLRLGVAPLTCSRGTQPSPPRSGSKIRLGQGKAFPCLES